MVHRDVRKSKRHLMNKNDSSRYGYEEEWETFGEDIWFKVKIPRMGKVEYFRTQ